MPLAHPHLPLVAISFFSCKPCPLIFQSTAILNAASSELREGLLPSMGWGGRFLSRFFAPRNSFLIGRLLDGSPGRLCHWSRAHRLQGIYPGIDSPSSALIQQASMKLFDPQRKVTPSLQIRPWLRRAPKRGPLPPLPHPLPGAISAGGGGRLSRQLFLSC